MRGLARLALILAALPFLAPGSGASEIVPRQGWAVHETDHAFAEMVERLKVAVVANGMILVTEASASGGAAAQGIKIPGNRVIGVFRNDYARRMLAASLTAGIEAPIRFYITEKTDGAATLSYRTPTTVFSPYFDEGGAALRDLAAELDRVFATIATDAAAP